MNRKHYHTGSCPICGSGKLRTIKTQRPQRRIRCMVCGHRFWTVEIIIQAGGNDGQGLIYTQDGHIYTVAPIAPVLPVKV